MPKGIINTFTLLALAFVIATVVAVGVRPFQAEQNLGLAVLRPVQGGTGIGSATAGDVGKVLKVSDDSPFTFTLEADNTGGGGGGSGTVSTSTNETAGRLAYWTSNSGTPALLGEVATGTISVPTGLTGTANRYVVGGNFTLGLDTGYVIPLATDLFGKAWELTTNTFSQSALAPTTTQNIHVSGVGTSTFSGGLEAWRQIAAPYFHATSTATSTFAGDANFGSRGISLSSLFANGSGGLSIFSNNGTEVASLGAGGGSNSTFLGGVNIDGATRLATSLTGLLKATSGAITAAVAGTDYVAPATTITVNGTTKQITSSAGAQDLSTNRTWTLSLPSFVLFPGDFAATNATTTSATTTANFTSQGNTWLSSMTSALLLTGADGLVAEYAGTSCTNQFVRALSALGVATCASVATTDITDGTIIEPDLDVDDSPADGDILTYDSTGTNFVWETILDLVNSITGAVNWGGITSFEIPNGTAPVVDAVGEMALDTTDNQLLIATSTNASFPAVIPLEQPLFSITVSSTSPAFVAGSGTIPISRWITEGREITRFSCFVQGGTSKTVNVTDGTNDTETIACATTATADTSVDTNSTFTANELWYLEMGASSGTVDYVTFTAYGYITRE